MPHVTLTNYRLGIKMITGKYAGARAAAILVALGFALAGCVPSGGPQPHTVNLAAGSVEPSVFREPGDALSVGPTDAQLLYAAMPQERFPIPAVPIEQVDPKFWRQIVPNTTGEPEGTIVVDTPNKFLFLTLPGGKAVRYGIGVGRQGFSWSGRANVQWKQAWPRWHPPAEMIDRQPELEPYRDGGQSPGLNNPLGARALYIFQDNKDTLYRIHGTPEWNSIGKAVSSGCIRMMNQDVIDLYERVPEGTPIVVIPDYSTITESA